MVEGEEFEGLFNARVTLRVYDRGIWLRIDPDNEEAKGILGKFREAVLSKSAYFKVIGLPVWSKEPESIVFLWDDDVDEEIEEAYCDICDELLEYEDEDWGGSE